MSEVRVIQPKPETAAAIDSLANHDLKALAYIGLVDLEEATSHELGRELSEIAHPDSYPSVRAYPVTFEKAGFADVFEDSNRKQMVRYYSPIHEGGALATIGALLQWSETYDYPLVAALSMTASAGESSAPVNTLQILDGFEKGLRLVDIGLPGYEPTEDGKRTFPFHSRLLTLLDLGMIRAIDDPVTFRILEPKYKGSSPFSSLSQGRQGFYNTVRFVKGLSPDGIWTAKQLEELARIHNFVDDASEVDFKNALRRAISKSEPRYAPGVIERQELTARRYVIDDNHADMVHELTSTVAKLDQSARHAKESSDFAMDAYQTPDIAYRVADRGLKNSRYRKA